MSILFSFYFLCSVHKDENALMMKCTYMSFHRQVIPQGKIINKIKIYHSIHGTTTPFFVRCRKCINHFLVFFLNAKTRAAKRMDQKLNQEDHGHVSSSRE